MPPDEPRKTVRRFDPIGLKAGGVSRTAMIIDDSKTAREMLKRVLMSLHFKIIDESENGEVALMKIRSSALRPDFIFVDQEMAVMDGIETVKRLKPLLFETKIIMVTSHSEKDMVMRMINMGIAGYVRKPYDRDTVLKALTAIIRGPS
jgi:DNA-binding NarL/FixJ family response regulator